MEQTLVFVKPDGVQRGLIGEIIARLEKRGLKLVAAKFMDVTEEFAGQHYAIHKDKPFYDSLIEYITASPVMAMVWEGHEAVEAVRQTMGKTNPTDSYAGSIRQDFGLMIGRNLTHASDKVENAKKEIELWFKPEEIISWERALDKWIFE